MITVKKINRLVNPIVIIGETITPAEVTNMTVRPDGYMFLTPGTYEVVFNETVKDLNLDQLLIESGLLFSNVYTTVEGSASMLTFTSGYVKIATNAVLSAKEGDTPAPVKRKPGRPFKKEINVG